MKSEGLRSKRKSESDNNSKMNKGTLHLQVPIHFNHAFPSASASSRFQNLLDSEASDSQVPPTAGNGDLDADEKDFILSQDFFCTPDYITPDNQHLTMDCNRENIPCPKSPEKSTTTANKKRRKFGAVVDPLSPTLSDQQESLKLAEDSLEYDVLRFEKSITTGYHKTPSFVPQSAVALRCRVMPPPCIKNPYLSDNSGVDADPFGNQRLKCAGILPLFTGGNGLSRYHTDFHEIKQIGVGNFSHVFKVLKRIDGCLYAVKLSTRQLHRDAERRKALMEVQALAALGSHENIVGYHSSWFEEEQLYIQMELCDCSLSINKSFESFSEPEVLQILHQIAKALQFVHGKGMAHLDVKPDNIYVKDSEYKLGDFGCATLLDQSMPIEEGDARYMPQEILNENYDHLDKVDIFSLGAAIYELIRGSPLPESRSQFFNLREGKLPLLPGHSLQLQNLLKSMVDPDPVRRPSAKELLENPIFDRVPRNTRD
ncbi:hypothetical protein K2173_007255 [Erythroxylum novogranatense]|uniref:Wee1-like protein kinase n=1 Tax=Erythroxylum novogranatense TaxID=1862640 RepID=A0AAV8U8N3_9ROSI|nr:hypothetical protein K2173_007255 [Erythroxylum novogranatense]